MTADQQAALLGVAEHHQAQLTAMFIALKELTEHVESEMTRAKGFAALLRQGGPLPSVEFHEAVKILSTDPTTKHPWG